MVLIEPEPSQFRQGPDSAAVGIRASAAPEATFAQDADRLREFGLELEDPLAVQVDAKLRRIASALLLSQHLARVGEFSLYSFNRS